MKNIITLALGCMFLYSCSDYEYQSLEKKCTECITELDNKRLLDEISSNEGIITSSSIGPASCGEVFKYIKKYNNVSMYLIEPTSLIRQEFEKAKENEIKNK